MAEPSDHIRDLLADVEGQLDAAEAALLAGEVEDRTRRESALIRLVDRLRGASGRSVALETAAGPVRGVITAVGADWVGVAEGPHRSALIPLHAVLGVTGLTGAAVIGRPDAVEGRLDLRHELRQLARDRTSVRLQATERQYVGTIDRVGADYVELGSSDGDGSRHAAGYPRLLPLQAITVVRWD